MDVVRNWRRKSGRTRTIYLGRDNDRKDHLQDSALKLPAANGNNVAASNKLSWKAIWRKLLKQKKKMSEPWVQAKFSYDAESYKQNFDDGQTSDDDDIVCRSFAMRFADPSSLYHVKDLGM